PYLYRSEDNPDGGIDDATLGGFHDGLRADRIAFVDGFVTGFFSAGDRHDLVSEPLRQYNVAIAAAASAKGTLDCTTAFATTDFRDDLAKFTNVRTLIIHGDADAIVPIEVSGKRTAEAIPDSKLVVVPDAPHGLNVTHADTFNSELLAFLRA
ncbi:MAG TPA: alpha/beta hydrolase, partial [Pseudonocardiaceae bacterium]